MKNNTLLLRKDSNIRFRNKEYVNTNTNELLETKAMYQTLVEGALFGIFLYQDGQIIYINPQLEKMTGYSLFEFQDIGLLNIVCLEYRRIVVETIEKLYAGRSVQEIHIKITKKDGSIVDFETKASLVSYQGKPALIGTALDITEKLHSLTELADTRQFLLDVFNGIQDRISVLDKKMNVLRVNKVIENLFPQPHLLIGKKCYEAFLKANVPCEGCPSIETLKTGELKRTVTSYIRPDGVKCWIELNTFPMFGPNGEVEGVIEQGRDITEKKEAEDQIRHMHYHDDLTDLPNRKLLNDTIGNLLKNSDKGKQSLAFLFIDLDRFNIVNDTLGHGMGDKVLKQVAKRLKKCVREGDLVVRYGGDEFVILLLDQKIREVAESISQRILDAFSSPFRVEKHELFITTSIGISISALQGNDFDLDALLRDADNAMYHVKHNGSNDYDFYSPSYSKHLPRSVKLEYDLRKALQKGELMVFYQPLMDFRLNRITGMEALLRWEHPEFGSVFPDEFIPIAEETGLIVPIGEWVLKTACEQNIQWQKGGLSNQKISVNISIRQFKDKKFIQMVQAALLETGLNPCDLELEITESIMHNMEESRQILQELREIGVRVAIDDFGTGYASLSVLRNLPIDRLKIDKSFISDALNSPRMIKSIIDIGHALNLEVVAEGVESEEQLRLLKECACDYGQGYLFGRPSKIYY